MILTRSEKEAILEIGKYVTSIIFRLKEQKASRQSCELYLVDADYDVKITVELLPKRSQKTLGKEMLGLQ